MRQTIFAFCLICASVGYSESPKSPTAETLSSILTSQNFITFSIDRGTKVYRLGLIDEENLQLSKAYYKTRSENIRKYRELFDMVMEERRGGTKSAAFPGRGKQPLTELEKELQKYARPTGSPVGEITRIGADFIAVKELGSSTEFLIPFNRILDVAVPASMQARPENVETKD